MHSIRVEQPLPKQAMSAAQSGSAAHFTSAVPQDEQTQSLHPGATSEDGPSTSAPKRQRSASAREAGGKPPASEAGCPMPSPSVHVTPQFWDGSSRASP